MKVSLESRSESTYERLSLYYAVVRREPTIGLFSITFLCISKLPIYTDDRRLYVVHLEGTHPAGFWRTMVPPNDIYQENMYGSIKLFIRSPRLQAR
ncbi:hypothetical protein PILCRDRAFT_828541 [Piloderma croceum F 1598]|uniref:Uncharacterized protein n=1 Tax=Piloderma croceum (strain F 1598) TaxID=765440 RepID=A0A0C3F2K1_PILCF|nr:hypothetical protein PILCRDRAFT_828541 [Piloderma croceum F 1598]